jgi:hypothetical protein
LTSCPLIAETDGVPKGNTIDGFQQCRANTYDLHMRFTPHSSVRTIVFACKSRACAPPPVGTGGSIDTGGGSEVKDDTTTKKPARTTRVPDRFATGGAVTQEGSLPLYVCNGCQGEVVWATSARTGRKYLANVWRKTNDARYYMKNDPHKCTGKGC